MSAQRSPRTRPRRAAVMETLAAAAAVVVGGGTAAFAALAGAPVVSAAAAGAAAIVLVAVVLGHRAATTARELAEARRALTSVAVTTHELLWRTDASGRLTWTNEVSRDLLGYGPAELVGRTVTDLVDPSALPLLQRQVRELTRTRSGWRDVPQRVRHRDGRMLMIEASGRPVLEDGDIVGYEGTVRPLVGAGAEAQRLAEERVRVSAMLRHDAVTMAFQPIVSLADGRVIGAEALTRFVDQPNVAPDICFARAWEVGLGVALELQSVQVALDALPALPDDLYLSINASPRTVLDPAFNELMLGGEAPLHRLVVEITEHESIDDYSELSRVLMPARHRGLRLAVDDAGAGYASFRHIVRLRPDHIKLDRELVLGIDADPARRALASAVVVFALEVGATVIAEGVEDPCQLDTLCSLSVDAAQGFYLGRPVVDRHLWRSWRDVPVTATVGEAERTRGVTA